MIVKKELQNYKWYQSGKEPKLQIDILRTIATKGLQSKKSLDEILPNQLAAIKSSVKAISSENNKFIQIVKSEKIIQGSGRPQKLYGLTEEGILLLIKSKHPDEEPYLNYEEFWKMVLILFNKNSVYQKKPEEGHQDYSLLKISIDDVFNKYEKTVGLSRLHFNSLTNDKVVDVIGLTYKNKNLYEKTKPLLQQLKKRNTYPETIAEWKKKFDPENVFNIMEENGLIITYYGKNEKNSGIQLSPFGIILLLKSIIEEEMTNNQGKIAKKIEDEIGNAIKDNEQLLPLIFSNWNFLKNSVDCSTVELLDNLFSLYFDEKNKFMSLNPGAQDWKLLEFQYNLESDLCDKYADFQKSGNIALMKMAIKTKLSRYLFDIHGYPSNTTINLVSPLKRIIENGRLGESILKDESEWAEEVKRIKKLKSKSFKDKIKELLGAKVQYDEKIKERVFRRIYQIHDDEFKEKFVISYLNDIPIREEAIKEIKKISEPIRKYSELLRMQHHDESDFQLISHQYPNEGNHWLTIQNILQFQLLIILRIKIGQTKFRKLLNEKNQFKELWNDAIEIIEENEKERKEIIHDVKI